MHEGLTSPPHSCVLPAADPILMSQPSDPMPPESPQRAAEETHSVSQAKPRQQSALPSVLMGFGVIAALVSAAWFSMELSDPPKPKQVAALPSTSKPQPVALPGVASIMPGTLKPAAPKQAPATKSDGGAAPVTLQAIAKAEAARQAQPSGPLYDSQKAPVALSYTSAKLDAPEVMEAQTRLAEFLQTAAWKERVRFVYHPEVTEARMQEHYEKRGQQDVEHGALLAAGYITAGESRVLNLQFACASRPETGLLANFHQTRGGKLLLDWESWSAWCEVDWATFKKERSVREVTMRALASESGYYNYEFSDPWNWLAVKLRSADGLHSVTGYIQRNSGLGVAIANLIGVPLPHQLPEDAPLPAIKPPRSKSLVTLRLRFPAKAQSDSCVMITDMLADRWMLFPEEEK